MAPPTETNLKLAALLRECATYVEKDELHACVFKALGGLHEYASKAHVVPDVKPPPEQPKQEVAVPAKPYIMPGGIGSGFGAIGKQFKKGLKLSHPSHPTAADAAARQASSTKNADRIKAELGSNASASTATATNNSTTTTAHSSHDDWCETHFAMGCACKSRPISASGSLNSSSSNITATATATTTPITANRPAFLRPTNPNTNVIASGWIEQHRRSKMRIVWKEILASLVEGRTPTEETTLWIQREIIHPTTGKTELEALHQIPVKWLDDVKYLDFYGDHRFSIKVYNMAEEILFKCADEDSAQNWVLTLLSIKEIVTKGTNNKVQEKPSSDVPTTTNTNTGDTAIKMSIKELRAIAHGAGINTAGMERTDLEKAVAEISNMNRTTSTSTTTVNNGSVPHQQRQPDAMAAEHIDEEERHQLEELQRQRVAATVTENVRKAVEERAAERLAAERQAADRQAAERQAAEEEQKKLWQQAEQRKRQEEAVRAEAARQQAAHEEALRQEAAKQEVSRQQWAEQQAAARQRAEEEQRRQWQQAEQRKRQDEAVRQQAAHDEALRQEAARQQWAQQQSAQQAYAAQQQQWQAAQAQAQARAAQQHAWQQHQQHQQQQQQYRTQQQGQFPQSGAPPPQPVPPPPKAPNSGPGSASVNQKYAMMANDADGQAGITNIKRNLLIHWALQPPMLQSLRPIHQLLASVHSVFPPSFGVPGHSYFAKWKGITTADLGGATVDEEKLKKAVKQLRFFLHPDKLPKDLNDEQSFICKMLWDVANDSWEEHHKKKEELDWIKH